MERGRSKARATLYDAEAWMRLALGEARRAERRGEVPIGCLVVVDGEAVARGSNETIRTRDPTAHAEIVALRRAAKKLGTHRLVGAEIFVTLEPCAMCAGAMIQARIGTLTFGCPDPKAGAIVSLYQLGGDPRLNHRFEVREPVLEPDCRDVLQSFFRRRRAEQRKRCD